MPESTPATTGQGYSSRRHGRGMFRPTSAYRIASGCAVRQPALALAVVALALHLWANGSYGYYGDELYYIVCGTHLAWGYVDHPPLIPAIAAVSNALVPGSLIALRAIPALAHAATIALTGETASQLGGGAWAQGAAALCVMSGAVYLDGGTVLTTDALQPLSWLCCAYALIRISRDEDQRWWLLIGVVGGVAFLSKYLVAFWLAALALGVLTTRARRLINSRYVYVSAAISVGIATPNLYWQASHGWPFIEFARSIVDRESLALPPDRFLLRVVEILNPATAPIWLSGLVGFAYRRQFADLRLCAIAVASSIIVIMGLHGKPYYLAGAFPLLFAGGATVVESFLTAHAARFLIISAIVALGMVGAPFFLPVLTIDKFAGYQASLGIFPAGGGRVLPIHYAGMFGWHERAALVKQAYWKLTPKEQEAAVFFGRNYSEAAAIDVFDRNEPQAIGSQNNYFLWGPKEHDGSIVLEFGDRSRLLTEYSSVEEVGVFKSRWVPGGTDILWICRGRLRRLDDDWRRLKHYD